LYVKTFSEIRIENKIVNSTKELKNRFFILKEIHRIENIKKMKMIAKNIARFKTEIKNLGK
jgi:ribosomal protein L29